MSMDSLSSHLEMIHSTQTYPVMEISQVQTHHCAQALIFVSSSYHQRGNSPNSTSHIHNFHRNQNPESYYSYLLPYLYHEVFEGLSLQYVQAFDATTWSSLQRPLDFLFHFQEPQNCSTHQQQCYLVACTEFQSELPASIPVLLEPSCRYPS